MPNTPYNPTWAKYEKDANNQDDANRALEASDKLLAEKEHELKINIKARKWEEDRKKEWAKAKPKWVKDRNQKEREKVEKPLKSLKELGSFNGNIKPQPGFLIVEIETIKDKTESGIYLADETAKDPNTGIVVEISDDLVITDGSNTSIIPCPVRVGDKILFKRYAGAMGSPGAEIELNGKDYRLMRWHYNPQESDILGVFYE